MLEFYMVWIEGTQGCRHQHSTYEEAREEAERLLGRQEHEGRRAFILKAISVGQAAPKPIEWQNVGSI